MSSALDFVTTAGEGRVGTMVDGRHSWSQHSWSQHSWSRQSWSQQSWSQGTSPRRNATASAVRRIRLRRAAVRYASHGWPLVPGACFTGDRFTCGPGCATVGCHPAREPWESYATRDVDAVARMWRLRPYSVLLATGVAFDVLEVPAHIGASTTGVSAPLALTPLGRWMFLVRPGDELHPDLAHQFDVVLHGRGSWIPAPPVRTADGRVRWLVAPHETGWRVPDSRTVQRALVAALPRLGVPDPTVPNAA
ncbi:MAG TPA: bifunctional DNA primase/polymerase [Micromonosporaceae bacterium]|nr:bifunctional DNA primase/polymerase [Micromonosporaceae bacterium]